MQSANQQNMLQPALRPAVTPSSAPPPRAALHRCAAAALPCCPAPLQAFMIVQDPYANSYYMKWRAHQDLAKNERMLGRGGWVSTRNYELVRGRRGGEGRATGESWRWATAGLACTTARQGRLQCAAASTAARPCCFPPPPHPIPFPLPPLMLPARPAAAAATACCLLQDSGAYFLHLLWNLYSSPGYDRAALLAEPVVYEAASLMVDVWTVEQRHEEQSQYRYSELPREGRGPLVNYTGVCVRGTAAAEQSCRGGEGQQRCRPLVSSARHPRTWHQQHCLNSSPSLPLYAPFRRHELERVPPQRRPPEVRLQHSRQHVCPGSPGAGAGAECRHLAQPRL